MVSYEFSIYGAGARQIISES